MGYFDSEMEEMLEVYLLETKQQTEQLSAVLLAVSYTHLDMRKPTFVAEVSDRAMLQQI